MLVDIRTHVSINEAVAHLSHGGASAVRERSGRGTFVPEARAALAYTLPTIDGGGKGLATRFGRSEHIERRAARREQHDIAALGEAGSRRDRLVHRGRMRDRRAFDVLAALVCRFTDQDDRFGP